MFLDRHITGAMMAGLMACAAMLPVAAQAETIVVRASGPSARTYTAGRKLADNVSITLKSGDVLTLLDGRGTRTLRGPGTFGSTSTIGAGSDTRTSIASLLTTSSAGRARTGAIRGDTSVAPRSPNLWYVDAAKSTTMCVADPANVRLWRPDRAQAMTYAIKGKDGLSASASFGAGESVMSWPADLPVTEGATYTLTSSATAQPATISFSIMAARSEGLESMASVLISRNCQAQLNLLVETVALPDPEPDM